MSITNIKQLLDKSKNYDGQKCFVNVLAFVSSKNENDKNQGQQKKYFILKDESKESIRLDIWQQHFNNNEYKKIQEGKVIFIENLIIKDGGEKYKRYLSFIQTTKVSTDIQNFQQAQIIKEMFQIKVRSIQEVKEKICENWQEDKQYELSVIENCWVSLEQKIYAKNFFEINNSQYYLSCNIKECNNKKVTLQNDQYTCNNCKNSIQEPNVCYKMDLKIKDDSGQEIECTVFNDQAQKLINEEAKNIRKYVEINSDENEAELQKIQKKVTEKLENQRLQIKIKTRVNQIKSKGKLNFDHEIQKIQFQSLKRKQNDQNNSVGKQQYEDKEQIKNIVQLELDLLNTLDIDENAKQKDKYVESIVYCKIFPRDLIIKNFYYHDKENSQVIHLMYHAQIQDNKGSVLNCIAFREVCEKIINEKTESVQRLVFSQFEEDQKKLLEFLNKPRNKEFKIKLQSKVKVENQQMKIEHIILDVQEINEQQNKGDQMELEQKCDSENNIEKIEKKVKLE